MDRRKKILEDLDLRYSTGAEIGPLCSPIVTRDEGHVFYVDYTDTETLKAKYANDSAVDISKIVSVDAIWGENTLKTALGGQIALDYVIASHVIEHVPDLVTWLEEVRSVLKPSGTLRLAVPDRRFTFDFARGETRLSDVLSAYLHRARVPQPHEVLDFALNKKTLDVQRAWRGDVDASRLDPDYSFDAALDLARDVIKNGTYHDVHCWVFTPRSFGTLFEQLAAVGLSNFACETFHDTEFNTLEFFVTLRVCDDTEKVRRSWRQMVETAREDVANSPEAKRQKLMSELQASKTQNCDVVTELNQTKLSLEATQRLIDSLQNSACWKLTAPLRFLDLNVRRLIQKMREICRRA